MMYQTPDYNEDVYDLLRLTENGEVSFRIKGLGKFETTLGYLVKSCEKKDQPELESFLNYCLVRQHGLRCEARRRLNG